VKLGSCDTIEQLCRRQNDLEAGVRGQSRWTLKAINSVSRSVPTSPELCAYHRYVVSRRIQHHRQQSLKQATTTSTSAAASRRSVDSLGVQTALPLIVGHPQPLWVAASASTSGDVIGSTSNQHVTT